MGTTGMRRCAPDVLSGGKADAPAPASLRPGFAAFGISGPLSPSDRLEQIWLTESGNFLLALNIH